MEVRIVKQDGGAGFLSKITGVLFGIFITSVIFALSIRIFDVPGVYVGLGFTVLIVVLGFLKTKQKTTLRMITWGIAVTVVAGSILYVVGIAMLSEMLKDF
jgi:ABC-type Fe3+-siderophore transport system permease subunit